MVLQIGADGQLEDCDIVFSIFVYHSPIRQSIRFSFPVTSLTTRTTTICSCSVPPLKEPLVLLISTDPKAMWYHSNVTITWWLFTHD